MSLLELYRRVDEFGCRSRHRLPPGLIHENVEEDRQNYGHPQDDSQIAVSDHPARS